VRTLVISDLHLGSRLGRDVLRRPAALDGLLVALDDVDRLVLLGDTVELLEGRPREALATAEPILRALGARVGADREVVLVPGNHDRALIRPYLHANGIPTAVDAVLPGDASPALARVVGWLAPARVSVRYPGVWLADGVWATHGHYLDRHLVPESAYGVARGPVARRPADRALPRDYEHSRRPSLTRAEALLTSRLPRPLARRAEDAAELLRAASMPTVGRRLSAHRWSRLTSRVLGLQMQRASIPAIARVAGRLGVDADHVVFGHVHRLGPLPADPPERWTGPGGRPRIVNSGSWVYEALLLHHAGPPHPYWPGGAVLVEDGAPPRPIGLLDHLTAL
jgi:UDP-2,3-diacylglucosamine pyrophosphatase LpxH